MLTPEDIEQKTFSTALRGYDLDEVDDFLDDVVATLRDLQEELAEARSSAVKAPEPVADESAVGRALIAAQSAADQIMAAAREDSDRTISDAREEADRMLADAREEAEGFIAEREARKAEAEAEMRVLSDHVSSIRTQLALLATAVADKLDEMDALIAAESAGKGLTAETETGSEETDEIAEEGEQERVGGLFEGSGDGDDEEESDDGDADEEETDDLP